MQSSEILRSATFERPALYGCDHTFYSPAQVRHARMNPNDRVDVAMGAIVTVKGERCELCVPAQSLTDVQVCALGRPFDLRRVSQPPVGSGFSGRPLIYDLRGLTELRWVSYISKHLTLHPHLERKLYLDLRLLASGITLRGIKRSAQQGPVYLTGEFNRAACKNDRLHLVAGEFREFDLHDSIINHIQIDLDRVDAQGLVLPEQLPSARCTWYIGGSLYYFEARPEYVSAVMSVWRSPHHCYGLANQILNRGDASVRDAGKRILKFSGTTMAGVLGSAAEVKPDIATVAGLIIRRNQLRKLRPDAAYLSTLGGRDHQSGVACKPSRNPQPAEDAAIGISVPCVSQLPALPRTGTTLFSKSNFKSLKMLIHPKAMNACEINRLHSDLVTAFSNAIEHFGKKADSAMVKTPAIVCEGTFAFGEAEYGVVIFAEQELRAIIRDWSPQRLVRNRETWWAAQKLANLHLQTAITRRENVPFRDQAIEIA